MTSKAPHAREFSGLIEFLERIPGVRHNDTPSLGIGTGRDQDDLWWVKFGIEIEHPLAWSVVRELGHVLNYVSVNEPLPTVFMRVSPPPYMNGGPKEFLVGDRIAHANGLRAGCRVR